MGSPPHSVAMDRRESAFVAWSFALAACTSFGSTSEDVDAASPTPGDAGQVTEAGEVGDASRPGEPPPPPIPPGPDGGRDRDAEPPRPRWAFVVGPMLEPPGRDAADRACMSAGTTAGLSDGFRAYFASGPTPPVPPSDRFVTPARSWSWKGTTETAFESSTPDRMRGTATLPGGGRLLEQFAVWVAWSAVSPARYDPMAVAYPPSLSRGGAIAGGGMAYLLCLEVGP